MPLLPTLQEDTSTVTFDLSPDPTDVVDGGEDDSGEKALRDQAKIAGKKKQKNKNGTPYCLPGRWRVSLFPGGSMNGGVKRTKNEGVRTCLCVRVAGIRGLSAGREAAAATASGEADQRAEPSARPGGRSARAHARLDVIQRTVTSSLSYLPVCPGGRGERGPAEEHEQAEQEHEQNQTR